MKKKVFITRLIPSPAIELLERHFSVEINSENRALNHTELLEKIRGSHAVLCMLSDQINADAMDAAGPQCRIFANYAVGYNNIDIQAATERRIWITNTPGVLDNATADLAWALLFSVARRIAEADSFTRKGQFQDWAPMMFLGQDITGKTLGVIGAGRIGSNFARKGQAFQMKILYTDPHKNSDLEASCEAERVNLEKLLRNADFISLHVPLLPETRHLIGTKELAVMKKTAILINTSRGPVVDEAALVVALESGTLWGAGLDVYEDEPVLHPGLAALKNVVLAPHIGSATIGTRTRMGTTAAQNIIQALAGKTPPNCVNRLRSNGTLVL
jgi:glyoxylate reductase